MLFKLFYLYYIINHLNKMNLQPDYDFNSHCQLMRYLSEDDMIPSEDALKEQQRAEFEAMFLFDLKETIDLQDKSKLEFLWTNNFNELYVDVIFHTPSLHFHELLLLLKLGVQFPNDERAIDTFYLIETIEGFQVKKPSLMVSFRVPLPEELQNLNPTPHQTNTL